MVTESTSPTAEVLTTRYGPPALEALTRTVHQAKAGDPFAPVTVIVPNNFVGIAARRSLASGDHGHVTPGRAGVVGVDFLTVYRLAELLGAAALATAGRRPVSTPVIAAAVRRVLADRPGMFAPVAEHPTTERRLVAAFRELSELDPDQLGTLAAQGQRAADVVQIHRRVAATLSTGWYTEQDLLAAARTAVQDGNVDPAALGSLVVHLPQDLSSSRAGLLTALAATRPTTLIVGVTGADDADHTVLHGLRRVGIGEVTAAEPVTPQFDLTSVSDADDEVRHVVRGIVEASRAGVAFDRMAVVYAADQPYLRLFHDQLAAAGVPFNGAAVDTLAESAAGRMLRRLLSLPDRDFRREDVAAMLAGSPVRTGRGLVPSRAWEQVSRDAGIVKGRADWTDKLGRHAADLESEIAEHGDDPEREWQVRRLQRQLELTNGFLAFMTELIAELDRGRALDGWKLRAAWCQRLLRKYLADQRDWPAAEKRAAERIDAILQRLAALDSIESSPTPAVFRRSLELELDSGLGRVGSFGNGVLVGPAWMAVGLDLDRIWIVGLSEGTFPSRQRDDSLLPDRERRTVEDLRLRSERTGDEHRHFLAALTAVGRRGRAHLLRPRGDLRQSDERAPSRWLVDLATTVLGHRPAGSAIDHISEGWVQHVASFAAGVLDAGFPATSQEYELRSLVDHAHSAGHVREHHLVTHGGLGPGADLLWSRAGDSFTRFDGNLLHIDTPDLSGPDMVSSATALETWARCPHQYFMRYLLRVDPLENPELRLRIDPLSRGTLVHDVLERFVQERIAAGVSDGRYGWNEADRERLHAIASEAFATAHARGQTGEALYWRRDQVLLRRDLDAFLAEDTDRRTEQRLRPVATELGFGLRGARPIGVPLPDGRVIALRGSIDLVDEDPDGHLFVIDYKTGAETKISAEDPHLGGTKLQLVLYAIAARRTLDRPDAAVHSAYWHIRAKSGYRRQGYDVTPAVQRTVLAAVRTVVDNINRGVFPQHPEETTRTAWVSCAYCDPDALGVAEARRRLLRKAAAPELEDYLALADPGLVPPARLPSMGSES